MATNDITIHFVNLPGDCNDFEELSHALEEHFNEIFDDRESPSIKVKFRQDGGQMSLYAVATFSSLSALSHALMQQDPTIFVRGYSIKLKLVPPEGLREDGGALGYSNPVECSDQGVDMRGWDTCIDDDIKAPECEEEEDDEHREDSNPVVQVSNYEGINDEMLEMYFENKRRSGGGDIDSLVHDQDHEGTVTIRFRYSEDAQRVLNQRSHVLKGINLTVLAGKMKKPRPRRPVDPTCIFLTGIAEGVNNELLGLYLENCTGKNDTPDITYGEKPGTAMVTYTDAIEDLDETILKIQKKKLKGQHMSASHVYVPDCVLVTDLKPDTSQDNIELYFENERRSGGGPVREVQFSNEENQAIVYFEDYRVVSRVVKRKHTVSKAVVTVSKYHDCLGATTSSDGPTSRLPKEFITNVDPHLAAYLFEDGSPHKPGVESQMKDESAEIIWPVDDKNDTIKIRPIEQKGITVEWRHWKDRVSQRLENIFRKFLTDEVVIGVPFYDEVCKILDSSQYQKINPLYATKRSAILLRGPVADVKRCKEDLQRAEEELKKTAALEKQRIKKSMKLSLERFKLFFLCKIKDTISQKYQHTINIRADSGSHEIIIEGLKADASEVHAEIFSRFEALERESVPTSSSKAMFIRHVEDKIHEVFTSRNINAACQITRQQDVEVIGESTQDVRRAAAFMKDEVAEDSITFQDESVFQSPEGTAILEDVSKGKEVFAVLNQADSCIDLAGFKAEMDKESTRLRGFIAKNAVVQHLIPLPRGKVRYLDQHAIEEIKSIGEAEHTTVEIRTNIRGPNRGIKVIGTDQGVQNVAPLITNLTDGIRERQHPITKPGIQELLGQANGQSFLEKVQRDSQCIIETTETDDDDISEQYQESSRRSQSRMKPRVLLSQTAPNGCQLKVCYGDLTTEQVDAIVNAANTDLKHMGGLARAIVQEGGESIQRESDAILRKKGRSLLTGEAVVTRPGSLPCRNIIHVAGPRWPRGQRYSKSFSMKTQEENLLYDATKNVLVEASSRNLISISLPAISSGIYGFPLELCAQTMLDAVEDFCGSRRRTSIKEIRFTNNQQDVTDVFLNELQSRFGKGHRSASEDFTSASASTHQGPYLRRSASASANQGSYSRRTGNDGMKTREGKQVTFVKGNIAHEKADVIINTVGSSVELKQGGVSTAILAVAGTSLQNECDVAMRQKHSTRLSPGEFIKTGAGNLACRTVYHTVCDSYKGVRSEQILSSMMQKVLAQANEEGHTSIAIPAIGTGNLNFPPKVTAQLMYEEALAFSQQNPSGSLTDIRFVVYEKDKPTIKAFEEAESKTRQDTSSQGQTPYGNQRFQRRLKSSRAANYSDDTESRKQHGSTRVKIGSLIVEIQQGDITKESTDVIVNSVGQDLSLRGPVAQAIIRAGGDEIRRECEKVSRSGYGGYSYGSYDQPDTEVFQTTAGRLPCDEIIHVATPQSPDKLQGAIVKALLLADSGKYASIAMPALGTGAVATGRNAEPAAVALLDAIGEFASQHKPSHLKLVKVTIFKPEMFAVYEDAMKTKIDETNSRQSRGAFRRGLDFMWSVVSGSSSSEQDKSWERPSDDTMILYIYARSSRRIDQAISAIEDFIRTEFYSEDVPVPKELVNEIDPGKVRRIYEIGEKNKVDVTPMLDGRAKRISIQGKDINVRYTKTEIVEYFMELQREQIKKAEDQLINKEVQWKYKDANGIFVEYGDEINPLIERAHRDKRPYVQVPLEEGAILIDFETMTETSPNAGASAPIDVHRNDLKGENTFRLPANWDRMNPGVNNTTIALQQGGAEWNQVQTPFQQVVGRQVNIAKIERVQIVDLYKCYHATKEKMQNSVSSGQVQIERTLYHGVNHNITQKINTSGFDRNDASNTNIKNQLIGNYGLGIYFTSNVRQLDQNQYVAPASGPNGRKHIYVCKVLTGEMQQWTGGMITPIQNPNNPGNPYDCAVDNPANPTWFEIFKDGQAYPEYLIEYQ